MTRISPEPYQLVEAELEAILTDSEKIISESEAGEVRHFIDVGEYELALETFCGVIVEEGYSIPESIYQKIVDLAQRMKTDKKFFENIKIDYKNRDTI